MSAGYGRYPPGSIAGVRSVLEDFSKTQIRQAAELIHAGHVIGFSATADEIGMLACEFGQACHETVQVPVACVFDDNDGVAYFGALKDATGSGDGRIVPDELKKKIAKEKLAALTARCKARRIIDELPVGALREWMKGQEVERMCARKALDDMSDEQVTVWMKDHAKATA